jgi:hypothetical protein
MLLAKYGSQASEQTKNPMPLPEMLEVTAARLAKTP